MGSSVTIDDVRDIDELRQWLLAAGWREGFGGATGTVWYPTNGERKVLALPHDVVYGTQRWERIVSEVKDE